MRFFKNIKKENGTSPVIAIVLMIAITIVFAAALYVFISGSLEREKNLSLGISMKLENNTLILEIKEIKNNTKFLWKDVKILINGKTIWKEGKILEGYDISFNSLTEQEMKKGQVGKGVLRIASDRVIIKKGDFIEIKYFSPKYHEEKIAFASLIY